MSINRGHETDEHRRHKRLYQSSLQALGWIVTAELHNCDIAAFHPGLRVVLAVEVERSERNVIRNVVRDIAMGCSRVLLAVPNEGVARRVRHVIERGLVAEVRARTALMVTPETVEALRRELTRTLTELRQRSDFRAVQRACGGTPGGKGQKRKQRSKSNGDEQNSMCRSPSHWRREVL